MRNQRYEAIFNENHGFFDKNRMKGDFLAYFKELANRKNIKWQHVYKHFERFVNGKCTFDEVDVDLCRKFMGSQGLRQPQGNARQACSLR